MENSKVYRDVNYHHVMHSKFIEQKIELSQNLLNDFFSNIKNVWKNRWHIVILSFIMFMDWYINVISTNCDR